MVTWKAVRDREIQKEHAVNSVTYMVNVDYSDGFT